MIEVINKYKITPAAQDVYIGRPSKWGNPFSHQAKGTLAEHLVDTRTRAVWSYAEWLLDQPRLLEALPELEGKRLVCWCKPQSCHGDVLAYAVEQGIEALRERVVVHTTAYRLG